MNLDRIIAINGKSGLFRMVANQNNGLLVEDLQTKKRQFASGRLHDFTPLASVSIYTTDSQEETIELAKVFEAMHTQIEANPLPASGASSSDLRAYFERVMPTHDRDKVLISHIKKIIRWFACLQEVNFFAAA